MCKSTIVPYTSVRRVRLYAWAGAVVHHKLDTELPQQIEKERHRERMDILTPAAAPASSQIPVSSQSISVPQTPCAHEDSSETHAGDAHSFAQAHHSPPHPLATSQIPQSSGRHDSERARERLQGRAGPGGAGRGGGTGAACSGMNMELMHHKLLPAWVQFDLDCWSPAAAAAAAATLQSADAQEVVGGSGSGGAAGTGGKGGVAEACGADEEKLWSKSDKVFNCLLARLVVSVYMMLYLVDTCISRARADIHTHVHYLR